MNNIFDDHFRSTRRTVNVMFFVVLAFQAASFGGIIWLIWWLFAHGFHDLGEYLLKFNN